MTAASPDPATWSALLKLGRNARELAVEGGADRIDRRNDHNRNTGGDQAVFNRGRTRNLLRTSQISRTSVRSFLTLILTRYDGSPTLTAAGQLLLFTQD
jgi:hypothetical protein